jgi:uncharacterized protein (DUF1330 family)
MPIRPSPEQLEEFAEKAPRGELYMLNLLKFKAKAEYPDGRKTNLSGAEAYGQYGAAVGELLKKMGGRVVFSGVPNVMLIGEGDIEWDMVAMVQYPSLHEFQQMTGSKEYLAAHVHREAGLEHQLLINCLSGEQFGRGV